MDARGGDASCKVNIDGITAVRNSGDFPGLFVTRYYFGEFNITNCKIFSINAVVLCLHSNGVSETFKSANGTVNIDNCDIITNDSGNAGIFNGSDRLTEMTVNIYNSRVNGHINNPGGKVYIHENTIFNSATANIASGLVKAGWNVAMDIGADTVSYEYFTVNKEVTQTSNPKGEGYGALYNYINYVVARNGYEGEANMYLSAIAYKAVKAEDAVTVTYNGIGGAVANVPYAVGGNVTDYKLPNYNSAAFTLAHNGKYIEEYAKGVTKDGTYVYTADTAYYTAEANVTGLQANVSLYADFGINLYIPAAYANLVTVEGQALVSALSGQYLKATAKVTCDKAADAVTFVLNVAETIDGVEYTDTCTVTVSLVDYANAILGGEYTDADKVLVYYMMNYANEAANYFGEGAEAIAAIVANNKAAIEAIYIPDAATDEAIKNMGISDVITAVSVGENEGKLAFAFNLVEGFEGTITVSYAKGKVTREIEVTEGQRIVYLDGLKAYNFGTVLTISAEGSVNGEAVTVTGGQFSLDTYVQNLRDTEEEEDYTALGEALKAYADVSDLYKNKTLADAIEAFGAPDAPEVEDVPAEDDTPVSDGEEV